MHCRVSSLLNVLAQPDEEMLFVSFSSREFVLSFPVPVWSHGWAGYHCSLIRLIITLVEVERVLDRLVVWVVFKPASGVDLFGLARSQETSSSYIVPKKPLMQLKNAPKPAHTTNPINSHPSPSPYLYPFPCHLPHSLPHCHHSDHPQQPSSQTLLPLHYHFPFRPLEIPQS